MLWIIFIGVMTIAYRETGESRAQFAAFSSFREFFTKASVRQEILNNFWLFVPLGAILYTFRVKWLWIVPVVLSILIEALQYFTGIGLCEVDDVITNSLGGLIGYGFAMGVQGVIRKRREGTAGNCDTRTGFP